RLNVTAAARPGATNVLAVEVFAQTDTDLGITFVDWNPLPPDKNLGLWRGVHLDASGPLALSHPAVITHLDRDRARLSVTTVVENGTSHPVSGKLEGRIGKVAFAQEVTLGPGERRDVSFEPEPFPQLVLANPRL